MENMFIITPENVTDVVEDVATIAIALTLRTYNGKKNFVLLNEKTIRMDGFNEYCDQLVDNMIFKEDILIILKDYINKPLGRARKEMKEQGYQFTKKRFEVMFITAENFIANELIKRIEK